MENSGSTTSTVEENVAYSNEQKQRDEKEGNYLAHESTPLKNDDSGIESSYKYESTSNAPDDEKPIKFQQNVVNDVIFTPGSHKKATIENTSQLKIECLDGFSPHEDSSSTPKQDDIDHTDSIVKPLIIPNRPNLPECQKLFKSKNNYDGSINDRHSGTAEHSPSNKNQAHQLNKNENQLKTQIKTSDYESLGCSLAEENSGITAPSKIDNLVKTNDQVAADASSVFEKTDSNSCMLNRIIPGQYYGQARHKDGSMLPILFEVDLVLSVQKIAIVYCFSIFSPYMLLGEGILQFLSIACVISPLHDYVV